MNFNLSREHQLIRKMRSEFTEKEVKPIAAETDRTCEYPRENIEKLKSLGYQFIEPKESMLACGTLGKGALADVDVIVDIVEGSMK